MYGHVVETLPSFLKLVVSGAFIVMQEPTEKPPLHLSLMSTVKILVDFSLIVCFFPSTSDDEQPKPKPIKVERPLIPAEDVIPEVL